MKEPAAKNAKKPAPGESMDEKGAGSAPHDREEKERVDADVDATGLNRNIKVSDEDESQGQEVPLMADELCEMMTNPMQRMQYPMMMNNRMEMMPISKKIMRLMVTTTIKSKLKNSSIQLPSF